MPGGAAAELNDNHQLRKRCRVARIVCKELGLSVLSLASLGANDASISKAVTAPIP